MLLRLLCQRKAALGSSVVLLVLKNFFSWAGLAARDAEGFMHSSCTELGPDPFPVVRRGLGKIIQVIDF